MGILSALGVNKDVEAEVKEAREDIQWIVQTAIASAMGSLTNENGLIPFTLNSVATFIGKDGPVDQLVDRSLKKADGFVDIQLKKVKSMRASII